MTPWPSRPFLGHVVKKSRADLYGPFWVCATLVVAIAVSGNLAAYLQSPSPQEGVAGGGLRWHYDFHKVTLATAVVFSYAWIAPAVVSAAMRFYSLEVETTVGLWDVVCLYGYSMAVFVPASLVLIVQGS